jgi:hypothetical protein
MLTIEIKDDAESGGHSIMDEHFRVVMALNKTARDAAREIKEDMALRFTLRNSWVQKGIRVDNATRENPVARVYSVDPYMVKQQDGETYQPEGHVAIPSAVGQQRTPLFPKGCYRRPCVVAAISLSSTSRKNQDINPFL